MKFSIAEIRKQNFSFFIAETLHKEILWAANEGKADLVESILMRDRTTKDSVDDDGYTPLHRAAYTNNVEIAKILLKYGADVNARTELVIVYRYICNEQISILKLMVCFCSPR